MRLIPFKGHNASFHGFIQLISTGLRKKYQKLLLFRGIQPNRDLLASNSHHTAI
jgi:hypothetical protein